MRQGVRLSRTSVERPARISPDPTWQFALLLFSSPRPMTRLRAIFVLLCSLTLPCALLAQKIPTLEIEPFPGEGMLEQDLTTGLITFTNGVLVKCGGGVLTAQ